MHDALAQFVQVLHQAHAREFCAFRHCRACLVDRVWASTMVVQCLRSLWRLIRFLF